jgi:heme-degrading monooxygenase HmoA
MAEVTEFITYTLKHPDDDSSVAFDSVVSTLTSLSGVTAVHHGTRIEDPAIHLIIVSWSSHDAFKDFAASESYTPWLANLKTLAASPAFYQAHLDRSPAQVLDAPCTEIMVAYGIEKPEFTDNLKLFSDRMTEGGKAGALKGWHASSQGEVTTPIARDVGGTPGDAALLLIGWDSKAAHEAAKAAPGRELLSARWSSLKA